jgi:hypothetical protein
MNRLFLPQQNPFSEMGFAAIAITKSGRHIGLLYRIVEGDSIYMIDLAWDHVLRNELVGAIHSNEYLWVNLRINPLRAEVFASFCVEIYETNRGKIPYAFGEPTGAFNEKNEFVPIDQRVGLTCASFVVSLLEKAGVNLIDRKSWGKHSDDQRFFAWIIRALKGEIEGFPKALRDDHHVEVERQVRNGAVRYKPTEVAGAASAGFMPISFAEACMLAGEIKCELPDTSKAPWEE